MLFHHKRPFDIHFDGKEAQLRSPGVVCCTEGRRAVFRAVSETLESCVRQLQKIGHVERALIGIFALSQKQGLKQPKSRISERSILQMETYHDDRDGTMVITADQTDLRASRSIEA